MPFNSVESNFIDVIDNREPGKLKSYDYISAAFESGIIKGNNDGTFKPNDPVTRRQIAKMVAKAFKLEPLDSNLKFKDVENIKSLETRKYIYTLSSNGIVKGYGAYYKPNDYVSRGQFSKIVSIARIK